MLKSECVQQPILATNVCLDTFGYLPAAGHYPSYGTLYENCRRNPAVVMNDCEDQDVVAQFVTSGAFWNMGENGSAYSRLIVHKEVKDDLLGLIGKHLKDWKLGDPLDPENRLGLMVSKAHFEQVRSYLEHAAEHKLNVVQGGATESGMFLQPTVVDGVQRDDRLFVEEIFGPVLSVTSFSTIDEAIELANDTVYGLAASAYTGSLRNALRLSREIHAGVVIVSCFGEGDASTPSVATKSPGLVGGTGPSGPMTSTRS